MADVSVWATSPLGAVVRRVICGFYLFFSSQFRCPLRFQNSPQTRPWEGFLVLETSLLWLPPWGRSPSLTLLSFLLSFFLPPFEDNGLPFWVPGGLHQHSEVALWYLLSIQMIYQWICEGESGLPVLFLHHLRTAPFNLFLVNFYIVWDSGPTSFFCVWISSCSGIFWEIILSLWNCLRTLIENQVTIDSWIFFLDAQFCST